MCSEEEFNDSSKLKNIRKRKKGKERKLNWGTTGEIRSLKRKRKRKQIKVGYSASMPTPSCTRNTGPNTQKG